MGLPFTRGVNELEKAGLHEFPALALKPPYEDPEVEAYDAFEKSMFEEPS